MRRLVLSLGLLIGGCAALPLPGEDAVIGADATPTADAKLDATPACGREGLPCCPHLSNIGCVAPLLCIDEICVAP